MSNFAVLRIDKLKSPVAVLRSMKHSFRTQETPNAVPERLHLNTQETPGVDSVGREWRHSGRDCLKSIVRMLFSA